MPTGDERDRKTRDFIARARAVHGDAYGYMTTRFTRSAEKLEIACPEHGAFWQVPYSHLQGRCCPECAKIKRGQAYRMTTEQFVEKARTVHGNAYDYTPTRYRTTAEPVAIRCPDHGVFEQTPNTHLSGRGCPACGTRASRQKRQMPVEVFVARARGVHGARYDYTRVRRLADGAMEIRCPEHGPFRQTVSKHLGGQGCPACAHNAPLETETFLAKARAVHGARYDYIQPGRLLRVGSEGPDRLPLTRRLRADPERPPAAGGLLSMRAPGRRRQVAPDPRRVPAGGGRRSRAGLRLQRGWRVRLQQGPGAHPLPEARRVRAGDLQPPLQARLPELRHRAHGGRARLVHADRYDYSAADYAGIFEKVVIHCPEHGSFTQVAATHLDGSGCPECGRARIGQVKRMSQDDFISAARARHGDTYDYSEVAYTNSPTKVAIRCPDHGRFWQSPARHLAGSGCPA